MTDSLHVFVGTSYSSFFPHCMDSNKVTPLVSRVGEAFRAGLVIISDVIRALWVSRMTDLLILFTYS